MIARPLVLLLIPLLGAQEPEVQVSASLNRQTARVGETVLLTLMVRARGLQSPEIEEPSRLEGFEVLARSDRSTFRFSQSLGSVREFAREYTLRVLQEGELTVPPIRVTVEGETYETEALRLEVEHAGAATDIPSGVGPRPEEEVAIRLWVEPESAYVGQQVTMTVGAFFDPLVRGRLQRQPEYRAPDVQGFWTADLPGSGRPERRVVGGREYFVQIYRRALFPLSPGTLRIPPAAVIYEVRRGLIYAPETFQVESAPVEITVRPLPVDGVPTGFAGAVGRYSTEIWFDRSDLRAGEAVNLVLEVTGSGNLSSLARPELPEIEGIRVYEGGEDAEVQLRGTEFAGHKRFFWVLVPERAGEYVVPELRLPYFDPVEAAYEVASTEPVTLMVEPSPSGVIATTGGGAAIRYVKARTARQPLDLPGRRQFWMLQAIPLLALAGVLAFGRYRRRAPGVSRRRPVGRKQVLRNLRPLAESGDASFFGRLRAAMLEWLGARLHRPELERKGIVQVQHALEDAGVPPPVALEVIDLLERCGRLRYAPEPPGAEVAYEMLSEAERLLAQVDKEAVSEKSLRSTSEGRASLYSATVILAAMWPGLAGNQSGGASDATLLFQEGVGAYGRGDYNGATQLFDAALERRPGDPNVLYNLGNAYFELDQHGKAVAYWVRALRIRPRDRDARYNLRLVIGDDPVVGSALPPVPLSRDELALLFTVLWFGGCGALLARRRWRKGLATVVGSVALLLALLCATLMLYPRPDYAIMVGPDAVLRAGPVRQSEVLAMAAPGTGYRVQEDRGEWLRVSRGGDSEGWVERAQVEIVR